VALLPLSHEVATRKFNKMTEEDYKYRQGRSKRQQAANEAIAGWAVIGLIITLGVVVIYNWIKYGI